MPKYLMAILSDPVEGRDDEYNDWYDNIHLPEVMAAEGWTAAQRFALVHQVSANGESIGRRYLALYEKDAEDQGALPLGDDPSPQTKTVGQIGAAFDYSTWQALFFESVSDRREVPPA